MLFARAAVLQQGVEQGCENRFVQSCREFRVKTNPHSICGVLLEIGHIFLHEYRKLEKLEKYACYQLISAGSMSGKPQVQISQGCCWS
jgi:hypothetical protein